MAIREPPRPQSDSEIPDLDVGTPSKGRPPGTTNQASVRPDGGSAYGTAGIFDDDLLDSSLDIAPLDVQLSARSQTSGSPAESPRQWPKGVTPEAGTVTIALSQVEPLCTWGPKPDNWWQAIPYAYLVYQGRRQLLGHLQATYDELTHAESRRDECLAALGLSLKDAISPEGGMNSVLQAVAAATVEYGQSTQHHQSVEAAIESETRALDDALAKEQAKLGELQGNLRRSERNVEDAQLNLKREQARLQRLGIERRNIEQAGAQTADCAAKLEELRQQAEAITFQINAANTAVAASRVALADASAQTEQTSLHMREVHRRKDQLTRSQSSQLRQASQAANTAVARRTGALADLGRAILAASGRLAVDDAVLKELLKHDEVVGAVWLRQQMYVQALDHYDRDSVRRGTSIVIAILLVFVLGFLWHLVR